MSAAAARKVRLRASNGKVYECEVRPGGAVVVGRDADLTIPEASVSRRHFRLQLTGAGDVEVIDLGSQNGTQLNEVREAPGVVAIVLEPVEGHTLADEIAEKGALAPARALEVGAEICRALAHAHERGVIHRNVSPETVMLTPEGAVKLFDFGL